MEHRVEFNEPTILSAITMGKPGKRTFFLAIGQKEKWVRVWLEKYLLETLATAIDQFLLTLSKEHINVDRKTEGKSLSSNVPTGLPSAELEIDEIAIGYDRERATLNMIVHKVGPQRADGVELNCTTTLSQLEKLGAEAKKISAAGRPICILCGNPIDPSGHICPTGN